MTTSSPGDEFAGFINSQLGGDALTESQVSATAIADEYGITDPDTIAALSHAADEDVMRRLATRLSPTRVGTLKPDPSQGGRQAPPTPPSLAGTFTRWLKNTL